MRVSYYMSQPVTTVTPQTEFHLAFELMRARRIHHLPVVEGDQVVGIVAERDLLLAAANFGPAQVPVGEIMRGPVVCVSDSVQLKRAAQLLVENHIGSLPVLNAKKKLVGMITETDIFKTIAGMLPARLCVDVAAAKVVKKPASKAAKKAPAVKTPAKKAPAAKAAARKSSRTAAGAKTATASKSAKAAAAPKTKRRTASR
jgi:CBS domain-containing protein